MARKRWSEMSDAQKTVILTMVSVELSLTATALVDLYRRPADQIRGQKRWWVLGCLVQPVGPIAYLVAGRVRD